MALEEEYSVELAAKTAEIERLRQQLADRASPAEVCCEDRMMQQPSIDHACCKPSPLEESTIHTWMSRVGQCEAVDATHDIACFVSRKANLVAVVMPQPDAAGATFPERQQRQQRFLGAGRQGRRFRACQPCRREP